MRKRSLRAAVIACWERLPMRASGLPAHFRSYGPHLEQWGICAPHRTPRNATRGGLRRPAHEAARLCATAWRRHHGCGGCACFRVAVSLRKRQLPQRRRWRLRCEHWPGCGAAGGPESGWGCGASAARASGGFCFPQIRRRGGGGEARQDVERQLIAIKGFATARSQRERY